MATKRFEFDDGSSRKFWEVGVEGATLIVCFGRLGTGGQVKRRAFASAGAASNEMAKLVAEKTKKGYVAVEAAKPQSAKRHGANKAANDKKAQLLAARSAKEAIAVLEPALKDSTRPYVRITA